VLARPELDLDGGEFQPWSGSAFRHVAPSFDPLSTRGSELHGGRWNQRGTPALYLALSEETALAEFERLVAQRAQSRDAFLPRNLAVVRVEMERVVEVGFPAPSGTGPPRAADDMLETCRAAGARAVCAGVSGLLAPSATGIGSILVAFPGNFTGRDRLELVEVRDSGWDSP
jgi:RES domain-containing protein